MYKRLFLLAIIVGITIILSSCGALLGVSIEDRIVQFESDLNGTRSNIIDNFSTSCDDYNAMNISTYWTSVGSFDDGNKIFDITIPSDPSSTFTTSYTSNSGGSGPFTIKFYLIDEGDFFSGENWKIKTIWISGTTYIN